MNEINVLMAQIKDYLELRDTIVLETISTNKELGGITTVVDVIRTSPEKSIESENIPYNERNPEAIEAFLFLSL